MRAQSCAKNRPFENISTVPSRRSKLVASTSDAGPDGRDGPLRRTGDGLSSSLSPFAANDQTGAVLLIDAANVVGSRPTGWWRDRAGAARAFVEQVTGAVGSGRLPVPVVVVLEGKARGGVQAGVADEVTVLHAAGSGDDMLIDVASGACDLVTLVTADRELRQRAVALGAKVVGPGWLLERLEL